MRANGRQLDADACDMLDHACADLPSILSPSKSKAQCAMIRRLIRGSLKWIATAPRCRPYLLFRAALAKPDFGQARET